MTPPRGTPLLSPARGARLTGPTTPRSEDNYASEPEVPPQLARAFYRPGSANAPLPRQTRHPLRPTS